jgi:hypothetical protein
MGRSMIKVTSGRKRVSPKKRREGRCNRVPKAQVKRVEDGEKECSKGERLGRKTRRGRPRGGGQINSIQKHALGPIIPQVPTLKCPSVPPAH